MPERCGSITVQPSFAEGGVTVDSCEIVSNGPYRPNAQLSVDVTVRNENTAAASAGVSVTAGGDQIGQGRVNLSGGSTSTLRITGTVPSPNGSEESFEVVSEVVAASRGIGTLPVQSAGDAAPSDTTAGTSGRRDSGGSGPTIY